jgi:hypothetical protein
MRGFKHKEALIKFLHFYIHIYIVTHRICSSSMPILYRAKRCLKLGALIFIGTLKLHTNYIYLRRVAL